MTIRVATVADAAGLMALWEETGLHFTPSRVRRELAGVLERDSLVLIDEGEAGEIRGSVFGTFDGRRGWVNRLAVRPARRGQGIATGLLATLEQRLTTLGCPRVNLLIDADNAGVVAFYAALGYQGEDLIFMTKSLAAASRRDLAPSLSAEPYVFAVAAAPPPGIVMFAAILEDEGLTLVLAKADADLAGLSYSYLAARITLGVHSELAEVGLTAAVSRALADAGISCNVIAAASHDHLFVDWDRGEEALALLRQL
jgi:GNAT superfamily N-acetyltransferase